MLPSEAVAMAMEGLQDVVQHFRVGAPIWTAVTGAVGDPQNVGLAGFIQGTSAQHTSNYKVGLPSTRLGTISSFTNWGSWRHTVQDGKSPDFGRQQQDGFEIPAAERIMEGPGFGSGLARLITRRLNAKETWEL